MRTSVKPPPPMLPATGYVTASANAVATAASTALPPAASTLRPTSLAIALAETTIPCAPDPLLLGAALAGADAFDGAGEEVHANESAMPPSSARRRDGR